MVHLNKLTLTTIASLCLAAALPASEAPAQQRLVFKVAAENTKYTQQHEIDVGDVSGHQVRLFEIHRTYPSDPPAIGGMRIVESWTRGISDYTNNNGEAITYGIYVLLVVQKIIRPAPVELGATPYEPPLMDVTAAASPIREQVEAIVDYRGEQLRAPAAAVEHDGDLALADDIAHLAKQPGQGPRQRRVDLPGKHQQRIAGAVVDPVVGAGRHGQMAARHIGF